MFLCDFHMFEERLNAWLSCLFDYFSTPHPPTPLAVPQCSMRLQVRTTSLQQRSADRLPGIWLLCVYSWRLCFSFNPPDNRWISLVGKNIGENTPGRGIGRFAEPAVIHRENFAVAYSRLQDLLRGELNVVCAGLRFFSPPNKTKWKS